MASTAAVLNIIVSAQTGQAQAALARVDKQLKGTAASGAAANKGLARFGVTGKQVAAGGVAALAYGLYKSLGASISFEDAFSNVRKTVEGTESELNAIAGGLRSMAKEIPVPVNELANLAAQAGALGVPTKDLLRFTRTAALLGVTTDMSAEDAANALARIGNVMGNTGEDFDRMAATLVDLGNKGASTEGEITEMALRFVGVAKQVGLSTSEVLGFSAALANVGEEAEAGGSAMSRAFIEMAKAVSDGGDKLGAFAKVAGISADAFAQKFRRKPAEAMARFVAGLGSMRKKGGDAIKTLDDLGLSEIRVRRALLALAGSPKKLAAALGISEKAWREMIAAEKEADEKFDTTKSKIQLLKNAINDLGITIGDDLRPAFDVAAEGATDLINGLNVNFKSLGMDEVTDSIKSWGDIFKGIKLPKLDQLAGFGNSVSKSFESIKRQASKGATLALNVGGDAVGRARQVWAAVRGIVSKAIQFVIGVPTAALGLARALWSRVKSVLAKVISIPVKIADGVVSAAQGLKSTLESIFGQPIEQEIHMRRVGPQGSGGGGSWGRNAGGTSNWRGGMSLLGERGPELVGYAGGGMELVGKRGAEMRYMDRGSVVFTASETRKLLAAGIPGFAKGKKGKKKPKAKATGNPFEAALAAAELTAGLGDDINAVNALIGYWQRQAAKYSKPVKMAGKRGKAMDWSKLTEARQQIKNYQEMLADLLGGSSDTASADSTLSDLYKGLAVFNAQRYAVSQAQYGVLAGGLPPFAGSFATGGPVPGPIGQPVMIQAHGGETVVPTSGRMELVITNWDKGTGYLRSIAGQEADRRGRRAGRGVNRTPGNAGALQ